MVRTIATRAPGTVHSVSRCHLRTRCGGQIRNTRRQPARYAAAAVRALQAHRQRERGFRDDLTGEVTRRLFVRYGTMLSVSYVFDNVLKEACAAPGLVTADGHQTVTAHRFRHTVSTQLAERGARLHIIMAALGHSDPGMSMVYAQVSDCEVLRDYQAVLGPGATIAGPLAAQLRAGALPASAVEWLKSNFLKTELELGHCLRLPQEGPCECDLYLTCAKFVTTPAYAPRLRAGGCVNSSWSTAASGRVPDPLEAIEDQVEPERELVRVVVAGDAAATADNLLASLALVRGSLAAWIIVLFADVAVAITLFVLLKPVSPTLSLLAAAFPVVYAAIQGINLLNLFNALFLLTNPNSGAGFGPEQVNALALFSLEAFGTGFRIGLVFFGSHPIPLGSLLCTSRYVPRVISFLVVAAGVGYTADSLGRFFVPDYSAVATAVLLAPAVVGELGLTAWLLVKGVKVRREAATRNSFSARPTSADSHSAHLAGATGGTR